MATAQENRFMRLALGQKLLTREQLQACLQFQAQKAKEGSHIPLWDCAVLQNMLDQNVAEKLQEEAGDLKVEKLGEFTIIRKLGQGGMGSVWLAVGPDKQRVALKVLGPGLASQRQFLTRFFREAQAAIKLQHPNIVRGIAVGEDHGEYFFAMEFVEGKSVKAIIEESGPLPPERATDIILQVAEALAYAHEAGIIHRDIKPDNIMLTRDGVAKLADLGLARQVDAEMTALTRTGTAMGTPYYMAPEQGTDAKRADARSDIYALGATWYHMVTGHVPFDGSTPLEIWQKHLKETLKPVSILQPAVPRSVSIVIERMMAKDPAHRIQSARELCKIIREQCLGERDLSKELGVAKPKAEESLWDVKIAIGNALEKRRYSLSELRVKIRSGAIKRDTPVRRAGSRDEYQPAASFVELEREFPRDYAVRVDTSGSKTIPAARAELHDLVSHYDEKRRAYLRKKKLVRLVPLLIELAIGLVLAGVVWHFWPQISAFVGRLIKGSGPAP